MQLERRRATLAMEDDSAKPANRQMQDRSALETALCELSQPISTLWCALEIAAARPADPEADRRDLLNAYSLVEELGKRLRMLQSKLAAQSEEG